MGTFVVVALVAVAGAARAYRRSHRRCDVLPTVVGNGEHLAECWAIYDCETAHMPRPESRYRPRQMPNDGPS